MELWAAVKNFNISLYTAMELFAGHSISKKSQVEKNVHSRLSLIYRCKYMCVFNTGKYIYIYSFLEEYSKIKWKGKERKIDFWIYRVL